ncbi:hypothetical protein HanLR1_Chr05g0177881 [Helianthus annuus]|nr:hypothetical protein HanLR1_Chr05g0177881 [Helianthus annuus]
MGNVLPCRKDPPKSLHDWKHKFFYICRGVILIEMRFRRVEEKVPKELVVSFVDDQWYKTLTVLPTPILQLDEAAMVVAGMSMLWAPKNPRHAPSYGYKGKSYCLLNALDVKVGREMTVRILPDGHLPWLDQIRDYFHHSTEESLMAYMPVRTCANPLVIAKPKYVLTLT